MVNNKGNFVHQPLINETISLVDSQIFRTYIYNFRVCKSFVSYISFLRDITETFMLEHLLI